MKTDLDSSELGAEWVIGLSRSELFGILRSRGLSAAEAFARAAEIQQENAARIRRAGYGEVFFGTLFTVGAGVLLALKPVPMTRGGFVVVLAGVAGIVELCSGGRKVTMSDEAYARATDDKPGQATRLTGNNRTMKRPPRKIPSAQTYSVRFGSILILLGIGGWLMLAE